MCAVLCDVCYLDGILKIETSPWLACCTVGTRAVSLLHITCYLESSAMPSIQWTIDKHHLDELSPRETWRGKKLRKAVKWYAERATETTSFHKLRLKLRCVEPQLYYQYCSLLSHYSDQRGLLIRISVAQKKSEIQAQCMKLRRTKDCIKGACTQWVCTPFKSWNVVDMPF